MKQLELLEVELKLLQENIDRVKSFVEEHKGEKYFPSNSRVLGELKHRCVSIKQRLTLITKITTYDLKP